VFGIILILMMIYRPAGILPAARRRRELKGDEAMDAGVDESPDNGAGAKEADRG